MKKYIVLLILSLSILTSCTTIEIKIPEDNGKSIEVENEKTEKEIDEENIKTVEIETSQDLIDMENEMLDLVKKKKKKNGLNRLELDQKLRNVARIKSKDIADNDYFDHTSPSYGDPFEMMDGFGIEYTQAAENLAGHQSVKLAHEGLMESQGHRENILREGLTHIGIGVQRDDKYLFIFTQMFIRKN